MCMEHYIGVREKFVCLCQEKFRRIKLFLKLEGTIEISEVTHIHK